MEKFWQDTLAVLRENLKATAYDRWIPSIQGVQRHGSLVNLVVCDEYARSFMATAYTNIFEEALEEVTGEQLLVRFIDAPVENLPKERPANMERPHFNPNYTFDTFVVGNSNRFAHAAAAAVAEAPSTYNPLFVYGGSGLGKTHLMHAIGQKVLEHDGAKKVVYLSTEAFTNDFINMVRTQRAHEFRTRYRNADILLIDDIQFLTGKEGTQEEFFHTFNALHDAGKQIVICSDRPSSEIQNLEERLRNRFDWGLPTDISEPDWETRCAILQSKAISHNVPIHDDVVYLLADKVKGSIRELEGALNKLMYYSELNQRNNIDMQMAQEALRDLFVEDNTLRLSIPVVQKVVADYYQISVEDLKSTRKNRDIAFPRQIAMYLCHDMMGCTTTQIGREFGNRHHTTVMHARDLITEQRMTNNNLDQTIREIEKLIKKR
ncbi:MAG: chromosomal replication initiator protein DnaA [Firmicutes bacterium]|nr:chromosomal replication initiator protein DnaA [Bacillota bacterium]